MTWVELLQLAAAVAIVGGVVYFVRKKKGSGEGSGGGSGSGKKEK